MSRLVFNNKQLLDEVFLISRIIRAEIGVISWSWRPRLITVSEISTTWKMAILITLHCLKFQTSTLYSKHVILQRILRSKYVNLLFCGVFLESSNRFILFLHRTRSTFLVYFYPHHTNNMLFNWFTHWTLKLLKPYAPYAWFAHCKPRINPSAKDY